MTVKFLKKEYFADPDQPIDIHFWNIYPNVNYPNLYHSHDYYEFFIVTEGELRHKLNGEDELLQKGSMRLVRPCDAHSFHVANNKASKHLNIAISSDFFKNMSAWIGMDIASDKDSAEQNLLVSLVPQEYEHLMYIYENLLTIASRQNFVTQSENLIMHIFIIFKQRQQHINNYPQWLNELIGKINTPSFMEKRAHDVYELAPYSPTSLIENFKKYFGCDVIQYLTKIKINYACNLLKNTNYSLLQICGMIGYDSLSHFQRIFKQFAGASPGEYRKNMNYKNNSFKE